MRRATARRQRAIDRLIALEDEVARRRLIAFTRRTTRGEFIPNWHHHVYARARERVFTGDCRRLIVCMPPQNGKSELGSRQFPAWALGRNPDLRIVGSSYAAELAHDMSNDVQRIIGSAPYRLIFPQTRLATGKDDETKTTRLFQVVGHRGYYVSAGVGGSIAGKTADIGLMDDPIKNREEAESAVMRKKVWDFFTSVFYNRQFGDSGRLVVITTRWHEDDLAGRLLQHAKKDGGEPWELISFPAVAEPKLIQEGQLHPEDPRGPNEPLWPARYPLEELMRRKGYSAYDWSALFQQQPTPTEGGLLKRVYWRFYDPRLPLHPTRVLISVDPAQRAKEINDLWAVGAWGQVGPNVYAIDHAAGHWNLAICVQEVEAMHARLRTRFPTVIPEVVIENRAAGPDAIAELRQKIGGVVPDNPVADKVVRAHAVVPLLEAGNVHLPGRQRGDGSVDIAWEHTAPWVDAFVNECAAFPFGAHDDDVDQMTQALRRLYRPKRGVGTGDLPGF
jgi:predicted phage terminase large subunit-like protein